MLDNLAQRAVDEALKGNWKQAENLNEELLKEDPKNKEALNRLARAALELGKIAKAKILYKKVVKIDPYNNIAQKALTRLVNLKSSKHKKNNGISLPLVTPNLFIEEPGKTKSVTLLHLGAASVISTLDAGQKVLLEPHAHRVSVLNDEKEYIGRLPDDLANRIIKLTSLGNEYSSFVRSVALDCVRVFIREDSRSEKLKDTPSFPSLDRSGYVSSTNPDSIHSERPDVSTHEAEEETE